MPVTVEDTPWLKRDDLAPWAGARTPWCSVPNFSIEARLVSRRPYMTVEVRNGPDGKVRDLDHALYTDPGFPRALAAAFGFTQPLPEA